MPADSPRLGPGGGRVAVLIPVYNDDGRLQGTLASLRDQGVPFTAVIVDDGSSPPLRVDEGSLDFPITIIRQAQNRGIERALNAGLEHIAKCGFQYVARLDNGDHCAAQRLARQQEFLDAHPEIALVGCNVEWRRVDGRRVFGIDLPTTHDMIARALHHTVCLIHPAVMFRTSVIATLGGYSYSYPAAEDYEFFRRVVQHFRVANLPEILVVTRFDPDGISMRKRRQQLWSKLRIQLAYFQPAEPLSYLGILKTFLLFCVPYRIVIRLKRLRSVRASPLPGASCQ